MAHPGDAADLRQRVEAGASVRQIAAELGVTERTVRNRLSRAGIPLPRAVRDARIDVEALLAAYRAWNTRLAPSEALRRLIGVDHTPRRRPRHRTRRPAETQAATSALRRARRPSLAARADGRRPLRVRHRPAAPDRRTVRDALRRHGLTWPPADADPVDRLAYIDDDKIQARAAQRIIDEATALAERARAVR